MDEEIKRLLDEEIKAELQTLHLMDHGSDEKMVAIENIIRLYKLKTDETKDEQLKHKQLLEQRKDQYFRLGVDIAGIVLPLIFYASWMRKGFRFEETGTFTSTTFRGLFNRFRPTK